VVHLSLSPSSPSSPSHGHLSLSPFHVHSLLQFCPVLAHSPYASFSLPDPSLLLLFPPPLLCPFVPNHT
jgi:hypothetical protein